MTEAIAKETVKTLIEFGGGALGKEFKTPEGGTAIIVPDGFKVHTMRPVDVPEPSIKRIEAGVVMHDEVSFCAYVNEYKQAPFTHIFAEPGFINGGRAQFVGSIDWHGKDNPTHVRHTATYMPRYSDQWTRWTKAPAMAQAEFAEWIEENQRDIREPKTAALLDMIRAFRSTKKQEFESVVRTDNGDARLTWKDETDKERTTPVPEKITLAIPVYFRGTLYAVDVWLRYRVAGGKVAFQVKVDRPDVIEDDAFNNLAKAVAEATAVPVLLGRRG